MTPKIQILMATYNGERFIVEQLNSILRQTHTNWELLIRDDGSNDMTRSVLDAYAHEFPDKIKVIKDNSGNLGFGQNFGRLMEHSTADYIAFADQDDVWHADKLEKNLARLQGMERQYGVETPLLVHHDFAVINAEGEQTNPSFEAKFNSGKQNAKIAHILVQPIVHGFSSMVNRAAVDKSLPFPKNEKAHDTYLSMIAATFGHIEFDTTPLADYRIHGKNVAGGNNPFYAFRQAPLRTIFGGHAREQIAKLADAAHKKQTEKCTCAADFLTRFKDEMTPEQRKIFADFASLDHVGKVQRASTIIKNGFLPESRGLGVLFIALG